MSNFKPWEIFSSRGANTVVDSSCGPHSHAENNSSATSRGSRSRPETFVLISSGCQHILNETPAPRFEQNPPEKFADGWMAAACKISEDH